MYKTTRIRDTAIDYVCSLAFIICMLLGLYFACNTACGYYSAPAARIAGSSPGMEETAAEDAGALPENCVAWLNIEDSRIDFPVMQDGDASLSGSVTLDSRNAADFSDACSLICGRDASDGAISGVLDRFRDEAYFDQHRRGMLTADGTSCLLQVFAVVVTDADDAAFLRTGVDRIDPEAVKNDALFYREPISERLLALTSCADGDGSMRTVVFCALGEPLRRVESLGSGAA